MLNDPIQYTGGSNQVHAKPKLQTDTILTERTQIQQNPDPPQVYYYHLYMTILISYIININMY